MSNSIVIGKRIPIGAAVSGLVTFGGEVYNMLNPDTPLSVAAVGGLSTALVVATQIAVVNIWGVSVPRDGSMSDDA